MKKDWKFWHIDHVGVCLMTALLAAVIGLVSVNLSMFNPVEQAFENFHMTDVYYEMSRSENIEMNDDIVMVDMVELRDRGEIGQVIQQINACQPRVLAVDWLFYKEGDDVLANAMLMASIEETKEPIVFSSKLVDYNEEKGCFENFIPSFFASILKTCDASAAASQTALVSSFVMIPISVRIFSASRAPNSAWFS